MGGFNVNSFGGTWTAGVSKEVFFHNMELLLRGFLLLLGILAISNVRCLLPSCDNLCQSPRSCELWIIVILGPVLDY
jgi:hypothetical protein